MKHKLIITRVIDILKKYNIFVLQDMNKGSFKDTRKI